MSRAILFLEGYTAGGLDYVSRLFIDNFKVDKLDIFLNASFDKSILLKKSLPAYAELHRYGLRTIVDIKEILTWMPGGKSFLPIRLFNGLIANLIKYPLFLYSFLYFLLKFRGLKATHFIANNGGYPAADFCRSATLSAKAVGIRHVFHAFHNVPESSRIPIRWLERRLDALIDKSCSMISVSQATGAQLLQLRNFKRKPVCIYNGIAPHKRKEYHSEPKIKLLHVGYVGIVKNQLMLIDCLIELKKRGIENLRLTLIGKVEEQDYYQAIAKVVKDNDLDENVIFVGFQKEVIPYYYYHDILLLCSRVESLPIVILEAMSVGMPIISTNVGGVSEQIVDGVNGYLVNAEDVMTMTDRIQTLYQNRELISKMGERSHQISRKKFSLSTMIDHYRNNLEL